MNVNANKCFRRLLELELLELELLELAPLELDLLELELLELEEVEERAIMHGSADKRRLVYSCAREPVRA